MTNEVKPGGSPWSIIFGLILFFGLLFGVFWLAGQVFRILAFFTPLMIIGAAILDYKVILGYFRWIRSLWNRNQAAGIAVGLLSVIGLPVVSAFWLWRAYRNFLGRKDGTIDAETPVDFGEYIDFEEMREREKQKIQQKRDGDELEGLV